MQQKKETASGHSKFETWQIEAMITIPGNLKFYITFCIAYCIPFLLVSVFESTLVQSTYMQWSMFTNDFTTMTAKIKEIHSVPKYWQDMHIRRQNHNNCIHTTHSIAKAKPHT